MKSQNHLPSAVTGAVSAGATLRRRREVSPVPQLLRKPAARRRRSLRHTPTLPRAPALPVAADSSDNAIAAASRRAPRVRAPLRASASRRPPARMASTVVLAPPRTTGWPPALAELTSVWLRVRVYFGYLFAFANSTVRSRDQPVPTAGPVPGAPPAHCATDKKYQYPPLTPRASRKSLSSVLAQWLRRRRRKKSRSRVRVRAVVPSFFLPPRGVTSEGWCSSATAVAAAVPVAPKRPVRTATAAATAECVPRQCPRRNPAGTSSSCCGTAYRQARSVAVTVPARAAATPDCFSEA